MIKAHEQQMELRLPRIGIIRKGAPKPEKGPGKDLDYFRLDRAAPAVIAAWNEALGAEPRAISGILPYAEPAENLNIWDELWQGKRLVWRGDGDRLHVQFQDNGYAHYAAGEGPVQPAAAGAMVGKLKVARVSRLRLLLPQLGVAGIFEVMSSSAIDADELWANLMWIRSIVATLQGAPVTVFRAERQFNVAQADGKTMIVKKYMLHLMLDGRSLNALLPSPVGGLLQAPPIAAPALAAGGGGEVMSDDGPDVDEGEYEDEHVPTAAEAFAARSQELAAVKSIGFVNGRLVKWANYVTNNAHEPRHDALLTEVLERYCDAVADNNGTHSAKAAEIARDTYRENVVAAGEEQEDLF